MRLLHLTVLLLGILDFGQAQSATALTSELPSCALNCILQDLPGSSCSATDAPCICSNTDLLNNITACVETNCTVRESLTARRIQAETCHEPVRDRHLQMEVSSPILTGVTFLMVTLRVIARRPSRSDFFGWDDALIILAWLDSVPLAVCQFYMGHYGLGRDIWMVSFHDITAMLRMFFISEVFYLLSTALTKVSILCFYLRVFTNQAFRRTVWVTIAVCVAFAIAYLFPLIFQCSPVSYAWTRWDREHKGHCIMLAAGFWSHAAVNMVLDLVVLVLPLPLLYHLQLTYSFTRKVHIFIMFSFGLIVTIISGLRLQALVHFTNNKNPTHDFFGGALWSALETYTSIICACLPAAKVFFFRIAPRWVGLSAIESRNAPTPGPPGQGASWATSSRASSANRLSKPPQKASTTISAIPEESDFMPLPPRTEEEEKRFSWVVTGKSGVPLQTFDTANAGNRRLVEWKT